ncbi:hypothetical protein BA190_26690 [Labrys sp. WJW]|uniref:DUF2167 domain-containing protein n=1 Tax=Labrys sp. WJW TaxID=1737983 RepID=UPI00082EDD65|nr:DUF2167 domain-containing protein [Labrys sp. WJW]OCC01805.1 hypothetical protein BA190_26690 [Labrys sp. WJW]
MFARYLLAIAAMAFLLPGHGLAQEADGIRKAQVLQQAVEAMQKVLLPGPAMAPLDNRATLKLPQGTGFVRQPEAGAWASASDYPSDPSVLGMLVPTGEQNWVVFIHYRSGVRIDDAEAPGWNAGDLLARLKANTEEGNAAREKRGEPRLEVRDWLVRPHYDEAQHTLIWGAISPEKGGEADEGTANIHGYALGNEGYFELTLVSPAAEVSSYVPIAQSFLAGLQFTAGNRYQDAVRGKLEVRPVTSLITPTSPRLRATALAYLKANWLWLLAVLLVLAILAGSALRALRR